MISWLYTEWIDTLYKQFRNCIYIIIFFEGKIPINVTKILEEAGLDTSENRTDHYLLVAGCDNIGIKVRNSRLEIKRRQDVRP